RSPRACPPTCRATNGSSTPTSASRTRKRRGRHDPKRGEGRGGAVMTPMLELRDVVVRYGKIEALKGVSATVNEGEIVTLIGANGAGKTTTLKTISGLRPVSSGDILFQGESIVGLPAHELVSLGIS